MKRFELSHDQASVYSAMLDWVASPNAGNLLTVGGYAGTGKSTLLGLLAAECDTDHTAFICYTGRASSIVGRKLAEAGVRTTNRAMTDDPKRLSGRWSHLFYSPASPEAQKPFCGTMHRLLYRAVIDEREELIGWQKRDQLDRDYNLIIIDEASMIDARALDDILAHGVRIIAVGDHGQLPPVMGDGSLMRAPMLRLEKIHRQAEGSPIIQLSRAIREECRMAQEFADGKRLTFYRGPIETLVEPGLENAVLCWRNQTRVSVNRNVRARLGYAGKPPQKGETVIALRNYPPVYNGMRGLLTECSTPGDEWWRIETVLDFPDEGLTNLEFTVCRDQFHRPETFKSVDDMKAAGIPLGSFGSMSEAGKLFDFGYAMTVHKSQGSQFKHAIVVVDWRQNYNDDGVRRLAYTAVTRAAERLTVVLQ